MVLGRKGNDGTGVCPTAYQAARPPWLERLVAECGFTGSYSSVQRWVKRWRREHRMESDGFAELEWAPGSARVDFG